VDHQKKGGLSGSQASEIPKKGRRGDSLGLGPGEWRSTQPAVTQEIKLNFLPYRARRSAREATVPELVMIFFAARIPERDRWLKLPA
jgi:hypothetical protein